MINAAPNRLNRRIWAAKTQALDELFNPTPEQKAENEKYHQMGLALGGGPDKDASPTLYRRIWDGKLQALIDSQDGPKYAGEDMNLNNPLKRIPRDASHVAGSKNSKQALESVKNDETNRLNRRIWDGKVNAMSAVAEQVIDFEKGFQEGVNMGGGDANWF